MIDFEKLRLKPGESLGRIEDLLSNNGNQIKENKMKRTRRKYSKEIKRQVMRDLETMSQLEAAAKNNVNPATVSVWKSRLRRPRGSYKKSITSPNISTSHISQRTRMQTLETAVINLTIENMRLQNALSSRQSYQTESTLDS